MALLQWRNALRRLVGMEPAPVLKQLRLTQSSPLDHECQGSGWQVAAEQADGIDADLASVPL
jgi:hypothetical protein